MFSEPVDATKMNEMCMQHLVFVVKQSPMYVELEKKYNTLREDYNEKTVLLRLLMNQNRDLLAKLTHNDKVIVDDVVEVILPAVEKVVYSIESDDESDCVEIKSEVIAPAIKTEKVACEAADKVACEAADKVACEAADKVACEAADKVACEAVNEANIVITIVEEAEDAASKVDEDESEASTSEAVEEDASEVAEEDAIEAVEEDASEAVEEDASEAAEEDADEEASEAVEEDAEEEAEASEAEEDAAEEEAVEEEEEGVYEVVIKGKRYYTTNETNGLIFSILDDDDVGDEIGKFVNGKAVWNK
jgi:hypothetical protein